MKKFLLSAWALVAALGVNAQEYAAFNADENAEFAALGLSSDATSVNGGSVIGKTSNVTFMIGADDSYKSSSIGTITVGDAKINGGIQGSTNPKDADGGVPATTLVAPAGGAFYLVEVAEDGFLYVLQNSSSNKAYTVFEEGEAIGYTFSAYWGKEKFPGGKKVYGFELKGGGEYNQLKAAGITSVLWPEQYIMGDTYDIANTPDSKGYGDGGLGVIKFPVFAGCKYIVNANGSKITASGFYFDKKGDATITIKVDDADVTILDKGQIPGSSVDPVNPDANDVVDLSAATLDIENSVNTKWVFKDTEIFIEPDGGRDVKVVYCPENSTAEDGGYAGLNVKNNTKQTIKLPAGIKLYRIQITGFSQGDNFDYIYGWGSGDNNGYEWTDPIGTGIKDNAVINSSAKYPIDPCGYKTPRVAESTRNCGYIIADIDFGTDPYEGSFDLIVNGNNQADLNYKLYLSREAADAAGSGEVTKEVWTIAGGSKLMGSNWEPTDTSNDMNTTDGKIYTLVKEDVVLEKGVTYEYKVAKDHAWNESYGANGGNATLTVEETAKYKVTFTFNSETKDLTAKAEKTGEAVVGEKVYSVIGTINGNWDTDTEMTKGEDGIYTATFKDVKAGTYKFKVRVDNDWSENYPAQDYEVIVEQDGSTVTVTFNPETKEVNATVFAGEITIGNGDANGDGTVNAADIVEIVNFIMGSPSKSFNEANADVNGDGTVNAADIVAVVNIIMAGN